MAAAGARSLGLILGDKASLPQNHRRNWDVQPPNHATLMSLKNTNAKSGLMPLPRRMPLFFENELNSAVGSPAGGGIIPLQWLRIGIPHRDQALTVNTVGLKITHHTAGTCP